MCGIVGRYGPPGSRAEWIGAANESLRHRGPDDAGSWEDADAGVTFAMRRLAIQDLSAAGHQPMRSHSGRYQVIFNGEIYNHYELRAQLGAREWRGHSDSETLLECLAEWGAERTLRAAVGMYAFALFDLETRSLLLARDRFGEKPLYYGFAGDQLVFGSELRALRFAPGFDPQIDRTALALYMRHSCVPGDFSICRGVRKLPPGSFMRLDARDIARRQVPAPQRYWSAAEAALTARAKPSALSDSEAIDELERLLVIAIKGQMISDVPLGAFLSGGIDSSTIVALMQRHSTQPVRTFSIGFTEPRFDESPYARRVAEHLQTRHTELRLTPEEALRAVPRLAGVYDEPFADSSQLPTLLVSELARRDVTVALSGDAGDELFAGYSHYSMAPRLWNALAPLPSALRRAAAGGLRAVPAGLLNALGGLAGHGLAGDRMHKGLDLLAARDVDEVYARLVSYWWRSPLVIGAGDVERADIVPSPAAGDTLHSFMLRDTVSYLPDDILVKVDRASMSVSLEVHVPLLDHRIFEFAWGLPTAMKVRDGQTKWLLRRLLERYVPAALIERPKMGFSIPLAEWLRGPLRDWAGALLDPVKLRTQGYLDAGQVQSRWQQHQSGSRNWQHELWNVLMFQAWLERNA